MKKTKNILSSIYPVRYLPCCCIFSLSNTGSKIISVAIALSALFFLIPLFGGVGVGYAQTLEWAKSMGEIDYDYGRSIAVDASGNVYTTGSFEGTADFDPDAETFNLTSAGGADIFIVKLNVLTGIESIDNNHGISVFPNPSGGKIQVISNQYSVLGIEIYNVMGEKVYSTIINPVGNISNGLNSQSSIINLDVPDGIYFIVLQTENKTAVQKLILQHNQ